MRIVQRLTASLILSILFVGTFGFITVAYAAEETCDCWCETKNGAERLPPNSTAKLTQNDCQSQCASTYSGYGMLVCATSSDQLPSQNITCFTAEQCANQSGEFDEKFQPPECMSGDRYCYPDSSKAAKVKLSTSIGGLTVPDDFGVYIASLYKWMLGVSTTLAIVFMMVAGLRWSLGGLNAEQVGKAKTTIQNAIIGLVLLLSTYLILQTVNPQLLKLQVPKFPMIRQIALVSGETSCGYLTGDSGYGTGYNGSPYNLNSPEPKGGKPYTISNSGKGKTCGVVETVEKDWKGNGVSDGTTCTWDSCPIGSEKKCFVNIAGGECMACGEVVINNNFVEPSSSICAGLSLAEKSGTRVTTIRSWSSITSEKKTVPIINQCFWTRDGGAMTGVTDPLEALLGTGTCAMLSLDCTKITTCEDYDTVPKVSNSQTTQQLEAIRLSGIQSGLAGLAGSIGDLSLTTICNADPCKVAGDGEFCYSDPVSPRTTGSWSEFVSLQGNDCDTLKSGGN